MVVIVPSVFDSFNHAGLSSSFHLNVYFLGVMYSMCIYAEGLHPYSMLFCISSVIERNTHFCDLFLIKWPKSTGENKYVKPHLTVSWSALVVSLISNCIIYLPYQG